LEIVIFTLYDLINFELVCLGDKIGYRISTSLCKHNKIKEI